MMVLCAANAIMEDDRRRSGLSSEPLDTDYENNSIRDIVISLNINIDYQSSDNHVQLAVTLCQAHLHSGQSSPGYALHSQ